MPRLSLIAVLAVLAGAVPSVAAAQTPAPARPPLAATVTTCTTGLTLADRTVVFTGSMPPVQGSVSMAMRFDLYDREDDSDPYTRVKVPGFGRWERSAKQVAGFVYDKRVEQLQTPADYRVTVSFRWYDAGGKVMRRKQRTSPVCRQPDLRPDLRVTRLLIGGARPDGTALYSVTLRNAGRTAIGAPFATGLSVDGVVQPAQTLATLEPDATATLTFVAPRCVPGAAIVATTDLGGAIDEAEEAGNTERKSCPAPGAPGF